MSERATEPSPVSPTQGDRPQPTGPPPAHPPPGRENGANGASGANGDTAARSVPKADAKPDSGDPQAAGIPPAPKQPPPSTPPPAVPPPSHPAPTRPPGEQDQGRQTPPAQPVKPAPTPEPQSKTDTAPVPKVPAAGQPAAGGTSTTTSITGKPSPAPRGRAPRRARLRMTRIDPWSVMKTAFLLSIAFAVVTVVAVAMVWQVLGAAGVWESINSTIQESIGGDDVASFQVQDYLGTSRVLGFTMLVAAIDVILLTAAATLTAFLYNMAAALLGGIEVTLAEDQD